MKNLFARGEIAKIEETVFGFKSFLAIRQLMPYCGRFRTSKPADLPGSPADKILQASTEEIKNRKEDFDPEPAQRQRQL